MLDVEGFERGTQRREPQTFVDGLGELHVEKIFDALRLAERRKTLQITVCRDERDCSGAFVIFAALDSDDAIFHEVDATDTRLPGQRADALHEIDRRQFFAVE